MRMRTAGLATLGAGALVCAFALAPAARAQDFFSQLFGGFGGQFETTLKRSALRGALA